MEEAMILNKSAFERGFGHGCIYKSEFIDITSKRIKGEPITHFFGIKPEDVSRYPQIDSDGLPAIGNIVNQQKPNHR